MKPRAGRPGPDEAAPSRTGQDRTGQERTGQERTLHGAALDRTSHSTVHKGRGATISPAGRFLTTQSVPVHDGWDLPGEPDSAPVTRFFADRTVSIITRNRSPDVPFDRSINPYKGCEHGCVYCFARPTHAYLDLSPGLDFETRIFYKTGVRERLLHELGRRGYECRPIAMGTNTDPYQPVERRLGITREILGVALECRHPVTIVTKSHLVMRDLDLLSALARNRLVSVSLSVTTLDNELKTRLEPRTASPGARLRAIEALKAAGVPVGALVAPVIPFVTDDELEAIVAAVAQAGAQSVHWILLRLPLEVLPLFEDWLETHYPQKKARVMAAMRDLHGGRAYESEFGVRMRGRGPFAELLARRFDLAVKRAGLAGAQLPALCTDLFEPPRPDDGGQLDLF